MQIGITWDGLVLACPYCEYHGPNQPVDRYDLYVEDGGLEYRYTIPSCVSCGKMFTIQVKELGDDYERGPKPADPDGEESSH